MRVSGLQRALVVSCVCLPGLLSSTGPAGTRNLTALPLVHASNLVYQGAFLLPAQTSDTDTFSYGGTAPAYDPSRNGLFMVGHDWYQLTAEVSIPKLVKTKSLGRLPQARFIQPFADATGGLNKDAGSGTTKVGGQIVYGGRLYGTVYIYYDATNSQTVSHWARSSTSLRSGTARGLYRVGNAGAGFVSGFMALVPAVWQKALGGPVLTGQCCIPIISRTSFGPDAFAFDPGKLGAKLFTSAQPLVSYPQNHDTLGAWNATFKPSKGILYGGGTVIRGMALPQGTSSLLFFGTQGIGKLCYGEGTDNKKLAWKPTPDGTIWCYDPANSSKGTHAYPYVSEIWAYNVDQLVEVKNGQLRPWQVKPYAVWSFRMPFGSPSVGGVAYDPARNLIYVSQQYANQADPVVEVYKVRP